jgi:hypothetical protein
MGTNASVSLLKEDLAGRIRVPTEKRLQILGEFDHSGMSGSAFTALVGVKYRTLASWRSRRSEPPNSLERNTIVIIGQNLQKRCCTASKKWIKVNIISHDLRGIKAHLSNSSYSGVTNFWRKHPKDVNHQIQITKESKRK